MENGLKIDIQAVLGYILEVKICVSSIFDEPERKCGYET